jgi:hypothetical protein
MALNGKESFFVLVVIVSHHRFFVYPEFDVAANHFNAVIEPLAILCLIG